jgi:hypothetical protein
VQQQLPQLSGPALALLTASLPQLLPAGGNLRLWRQLGGVVQAQAGRLSAAQLCEVLPLVQAADLPLPVEWLTTSMQNIQVCSDICVQAWQCCRGPVAGTACLMCVTCLRLPSPTLADADVALVQTARGSPSVLHAATPSRPQHPALR